MTDDIKRQLAAAGIKTPQEPRTPAKRTSVPPKTQQGPTARETAAIAEVAKVGRYKGHYEAQPARRYVLRNDAEADALDAAFYQITNTQP
jgi:hypothetical protein